MSGFKESFKLNNGLSMPKFGLGTFLIQNVGESYNAVCDALEAGIAHIDCAAVYRNEKEIGLAFQDMIIDSSVKYNSDPVPSEIESIERRVSGEKKPLIKRSDVFVTSKLWNSKHRPEDVHGACEQTLKDLRLDYLDLYLLHWPVAFQGGDDMFPRDSEGKIILEDTDFMDTWKAMEKLVEEGLVKSIGVSNMNVEQVQRVLTKGTIKPVANQIELNPYLAEFDLCRFCEENGVVVTSYSSLGNPSKPWRLPNEKIIFEDETILGIAEKHSKVTGRDITAVQVILNYLVARNVAVIPKSIKKERIISNGKIWDFKLSAEEMKQMDALNRNERTNFFTEGIGHKFYPF
eukprot:Nk52_evm69s226 gene=Nk52_evmTU69s226